MPTPNPNEKQDDYISRCIPIVMKEGTAKDNKQAAAICHSMWDEHKKKKSMNSTINDSLVEAIRAREKKFTEHNYGILPASAYVKTIKDCVGLDVCYKYAATRSTSFADLMEKAAKTLTYNNPEMILEEKMGNGYEDDTSDVDFEIPKNSLMVFKHILTTSRKDRDGDILRTEGAVLDPKMLLLWQHIHTIPIGKMCAIANHNSSKLSIISALVDVNDMAHDAAVMIDNGMGRFSHGFKALDFTKVKDKEQQGKPTGQSGFDVKRFEIMEASLVSVPANPDATTEEVLLDLVEGGKVKSGLMKGIGQNIRSKRAVRMPVLLDLNVSVNGKPTGDFKATVDHEKKEEPETKSCGCDAKPGEECGCASNKENDSSEKARESKPEEMTCPECGGKVTDGVCQKCGYTAKDKSEDELEEKNLEIEEIEEEEVEIEVEEIDYDKALSFLLTETSYEERSKAIAILKCVNDELDTEHQTASVMEMFSG